MVVLNQRIIEIDQSQSSKMIANLLAFKIRKDVVRKNAKINHKEYRGFLPLVEKIKYLLGYHKKKNILFVIASLVIWTYDLQKPIYNYCLNIHSPVDIFTGFIGLRQKTDRLLNQQSLIELNLQTNTLNLLLKFYRAADQHLFFGVGRNYLFQVYERLNLFQKEEDRKNFWIQSGFYKKRNQLASGVGCVQFLKIFQQAFEKEQKSNKMTTEADFLKKFIVVFIQEAEQIKRWEIDFNKSRESQFLKSLPGQNQKKQEIIQEWLRQNVEMKEEEIERRLIQIGLKGMTLADKHLYWRNRKIMSSLKEATILRRLSATTTASERNDLQLKLHLFQADIHKSEDILKKSQSKYQDFYSEQLFS